MDRGAGGQHAARPGQVHGHQRRRHRERDDRGPLRLQQHRGAGVHPAGQRIAVQPAIGQVSRRYELGDNTWGAATNLGLHRQRQPEMEPAVTTWHTRLTARQRGRQIDLERQVTRPPLL